MRSHTDVLILPVWRKGMMVCVQVNVQDASVMSWKLLASSRLATCSSLHLLNKLGALGRVCATDWPALLPRQPFFSLLYDSERVHNPLVLLWARIWEHFSLSLFFWFFPFLLFFLSIFLVKIIWPVNALTVYIYPNTAFPNFLGELECES